MANEMGNNNTSGLKEEYNTTVEDHQEVLKDIVTEENHVIPAIEDKDLHEKVNGLASNDLSVDKQKRRKEEQEESEVLPLDDSSTNVTGEADEEEEGKEKSSFDKESTTPHDPEPEKSAPENISTTPLPQCIKQGSDIIQDEPSPPEANGLSDGAENKQALLSSTCASAENDHLPDIEVTENLEDSVDTESNAITVKKMDEPLAEQECEPEDGAEFENEFSNATPASSDFTGPSEKSDEGFSTEVSLTRDVCSESQSKPHKEDPETEDKCMVVEEENRLEFENGAYKNDNNSSSQLCEDMVKESETGDSNAIQTKSIDLDQKDVVNPSSDDIVVSHISNQNWVPEEVCQDSEADVTICPQLGIITPESNIADCNPKEEKSKEKRIAEEGEENMESLYSIEIETEEAKTGEVSLPVDHQQESVSKSATFQSENWSIQEPKQDTSGEFLATQASTLETKNLIAEIIVSMNELAVDKTKQDVKQCIEIAKISPKSGTSASARESVERLSMGSMERFSTDFEPDNTSVLYDQMTKSPSFSLDLQTEAKSEESDRTPLLYHDKAAIQSSPSQDDVSLGIPLTLNGFSSQDEPMPIEEKVVTLERSDPEKSKTPFLGFLNEEEEAHIDVTPQKEKETKDLFRSSSTKETTSSTSTKGKEKRRARSCLFGNCMCCGTVIN